MLKLKFKNEPYWLDLGMGVRVKVKPCTSSVFYEAKAYMNSKVADMAKRIKDVRENGAKDDNLPNLEDTHASLLLFAGVSIASVARRLGHASMTTTQKTYLHIIHELENKDVDIVMRSLSGLI